jgi:hypothetical protein
MRVFHLLRERARLFGPLAPILGVIHEGRWHAATPITRRQVTRHAALIFLLRRVRQLWSDVGASVGNVGYNAVTYVLGELLPHQRRSAEGEMRHAREQVDNIRTML